MNTYHILNGDALKQQFPTDRIAGELIVTRECLVDGPVHEKSLYKLIKLRSTFIKDAYGSDNYAAYVVSEIDKIRAIEEGDINLWFEEDLFCQINLWFICSLLYLKDASVNLVLPENSLRYGFGGLDKAELQTTYDNRIPLTRIQTNQFALLWFAYRFNDIERLLKLGVQMYSDFPFVMRAIEAHFDRIPRDGNPGLPEQLVLDIMDEKSSKDFEIIFQEFSERAPIYGYGDLQVKRIFDKILNG